jgi:hypothetical protein
MRLVLSLFISMTLAGCGVDRTLLIGATVGGGAGVTNVTWNGVTQADGFVLDYPADSALHGEGLEFFMGPTRVPLAPATQQVMGEGGPFNRTHYDASPLPLDEYLVVHRRASGTGDPYTADEERSFTTFDGEPALVTTIQILRAGPVDAGAD